MRKLILALTVVSMVAATAARAGGDHWVADFDKAVETAKAQNKNLLVDFTGSDWCGWCIKLNDEVFKHEAFLTAAQKDYVLVALDFPNGEEAKAKVPNPERNAELRDKYGIRGYPTILLVTPEGEVLGRTGYKPGGPEKYVEHLAALRKDYDMAMAFVKEWDAADEAAKPALWEKACTTLGESESETTKRKLAPIVATALKTDADNAQGKKLRALTVLIDAGVAGDAEYAVVAEFDAKNEHGLLEKAALARMGTISSKDQIAPVLELVEKVAAAGFKDKETGFKLMLNSAFMSKQHLGDAARASKFAKAALAIGTDNERAEKFLKTLVVEEEEAQEDSDEAEVEEVEEEEEAPAPQKQP